MEEGLQRNARSIDSSKGLASIALPLCAACIFLTTRSLRALDAQPRAAASSQASRASSDVESARRKLLDHPGDRDANLVVGKWECFTANDWERGAARLAKGSDAKLAALARLEITHPEGAGAAKLADAWWDFAHDKSVASMLKNKAMRRAGHWYATALSNLSGVEAQLAIQRIAEIVKLDEPTIWLSSLAESRADGLHMDFGWGVAKDHLHPDGSGALVMNGVNHAHGIALNPQGDRTARIDYKLGRKYARFTGIVGLNDTAVNFNSTLDFKILGNGGVLWSSGPFKKGSKPVSFDVDISGVDLLELQVKCVGSDLDGHVVWADPLLTRIK